MDYLEPSSDAVAGMQVSLREGVPRELVALDAGTLLEAGSFEAAQPVAKDEWAPSRKVNAQRSKSA